MNENIREEDYLTGNGVSVCRFDGKSIENGIAVGIKEPSGALVYKVEGNIRKVLGPTQTWHFIREE